jgi:cytochrome c oxidase subunit 2
MNSVSIQVLGGINQWLHNLMFRRASGTEFGQASDAVYMFIFWTSVVSFVVLMTLMGVFMVRYRRRPGVIGPRSVSHNTPLELFWTIVPTIFLVFMFFYGFWGFADAVVAPGNAMVLDLHAQKWQWSLTYPNGAMSGKVMSTPTGGEAYDPSRNNPQAPIKHLGSVEVPLIVVPVDTPVQFRMISSDVIHAFWVPDFRAKFDVMPNRYTTYWFHARPDQLGDHWIFCAEYCGDNHSEMLGILRVVPWEQYQETVEKWGPAGMDPVEYGKFLYKARGCAGCHSVNGDKNTGPTWLNMFGYEHEYTDGKKRLSDDNHVRESILVPGAAVRLGFPNQMTPFAGVLSEKEISALISYIRTLSDKGGGSESAPASGK